MREARERAQLRDVEDSFRLVVIQAIMPYRREDMRSMDKHHARFY